MSSTAVEFGLIHTFRTHNVLLDTLLCVLVPLFVQKVVARMEQSPRSVLAMFSNFFFPTKNKHRVTRVIEVKQRFNRWGKVQDHEQQSHLLQKAVSLYLVDVLDLKSKNAQYELLEKTKKTRITKSLLNSTGSESGCSMTDSESSDNSDNDNNNNDDQYCSKMDRLNVEVLPSLNESPP